VVQQGLNTVCGVNVVGMRRVGMANSQIDAVRRAFVVLFRGGHTLPRALAQVEAELGTVEVVAEMVSFIRQSTRGINGLRDRGSAEAA
jgi:UDP-N-acetylglucosamine acyltransferase